MPFTLGIDYGTNSVRALIVRCADGREFGSLRRRLSLRRSRASCSIPADDHLARQHPGDYLFGLEASVTRRAGGGGEAARVLRRRRSSASASTPPARARCRRRRESRRSRSTRDGSDNLAAQCWLWKDHTGWREAARITELAAQHRPQYHRQVRQHLFLGMVLVENLALPQRRARGVRRGVFAGSSSPTGSRPCSPGVTDPRAIKRGVCAAGHKALYCDEWGGLPDKEFLARSIRGSPRCATGFTTKAFDATAPAGTLCPEWAAKLGLPAGIPDRDRRIRRPLRRDRLRRARGHAGQGDRHLDLRLRRRSARQAGRRHPRHLRHRQGRDPAGLSTASRRDSRRSATFSNGGSRASAGATPRCTRELTARGRRRTSPAQSGLLALDWNNGNRTILVDPLLTGLHPRPDLHTTRAEIYRALIEATAFGARAIIERIAEYGVPIERVVCSGGIAEKNPLLMQIYADVTGCAMQVAGSSQACALGSAIAAAVLAAARHPRFRRRASGDDVAQADRLRADPGKPGRLRPALRALPRSCTTPSAA